MELRHLRYFVTVAEELNFSKAAQRLYTAQPSLSQQIKELENRLGFKLFNRTKRKVEITHEGNLFIPYAKATLAQVEYAIDAARLKAKEEKNYLKIGFVPVAESKVFPYILPSLRFDNPNLKITLHSLNACEQQHALENKEIDIAIVREDLATQGYESKLMLQESLILLLPAQHPLAKLDKIHLPQLKHIDVIIPAPTHAPTLYQCITEFFTNHQIKVNYIQQAENIVFNINSVSMGLGCAILPSYVLPIIKNNPAILVKELSVDLPKLNLYACYQRHHNQRNISKFLLALKQRLPLNASLIDDSDMSDQN